MKKIILEFCVIAFSVSAMMADELSTRLMWNCVERKKLNEPNKQVKIMTAECLVKLENMVAQQGSQDTFKEYEYIWSPQEPFQNVVTRLVSKIIKERKYNPNDGTTIQKVQDEIARLNKSDDYQTLACLYIDKANSKCLK